MHLCLLSHYFFLRDCKFKISVPCWFFCAEWRKYFKFVEMIAGKMIKIIKRPPLHFVLEAKRATQILLGRMRKSLDFVPLRRIWINYWTIFLHSHVIPLWNMWVRNSNKNIQHPPDYIVMKPFERGVKYFIEGYLHNRRSAFRVIIFELTCEPWKQWMKNIRRSKSSRSLQITLSVIAVRQLIVQFTRLKPFSAKKLTYFCRI